MTPELNPPKFSSRLLSLDFMRGLIMVLLMAESTGLYDHINEALEPGILRSFAGQFFHHPWNGLYFWDLIQPGFMFIAGTAMAYSLQKQWQNGVSWNESFRKILVRCFWLFFWGVLNYAVRKNGLSFELWNVLTQLSFTTLVAFLIFRWKISYQILFCAALLLLTEVLYRITDIPGFDQPFTDQHNFGNYMDLILMNKINGDGWVAINCIPTAVHTIAGALVGKLLISNGKPLKYLFGWGLICLVLGYALDFSGITPIIKRISTSSFVLASLGWCLLGLATCYWWIDVKDHRKCLKFFTIVGMNSIFIYLFFEIIGHRWFNGYVQTIVHGLTGPVGFGGHTQNILGSLVIFALEWGLCWFLYKKKLFFKL
ncbi:DUF5009 domain-containing protein [Pollutibacter soli]|uniref:acyltransferase family protein n=1 Tax=Pollutibacter soli TaxID=3034157 RepID=UPI0030134A0B